MRAPVLANEVDEVKIVHFSDWHGVGIAQLPEADLYICTGDMYPDFHGYRTSATELAQHDWPLTYAPLLTSPEAPVVCVRGNHDMIPTARLFEGPKRQVYEIDRASQPHTVLGLRIGGFWGVRAIGPSKADPTRLNGADPTQDARLVERVKALPRDLDILVTHMPPQGCLDRDDVREYGLRELREWIFDCQPELHCFGHVHESTGLDRLKGTLMSNAACGYNEIEL